jgi:hypothetical protein
MRSHVVDRKSKRDSASARSAMLTPEQLELVLYGRANWT